jgi:ADP-ribosylglycohydrolase
MLGLAVGDALGTTLEFKPPGTFRPIDDIVGGGPFGLESGEWTDDTSMALCLAESLIERRDFDPADQLRRYVRWYREGHMSATGECFDIGGATSEALHRFENTGEPNSGSRDPNRAGNGSLMRLAAVPLFYARAPVYPFDEEKPVEAIERSGDSSRTTHGARVTVDACRYMGALIAGAVNGVDKEDLLSERYSPVGNRYWQEYPLGREIDEVGAGSFKRKEPPQIRGRGYVAASLEAALWAFYKSDSFEEGALLAVNLGEDADTTGAIYGQLAGAFYGERGIPANWKRKLAHRLLIEYFAERLYQVGKTSTGISC